jgi:serine/threonine protein kinase
MAARILEPGSRLGKYEVLAHIATGGMGAVYKAQDIELRRVVALKVLSADLAARPNVLERFRREARHAARLSHKNIVTLFETGQDQDLYYLAMEFIEGIDLGVYIERKGKLGAEETRRILIQATNALEHAFQQGVIHRDIKPSNFLLSKEGNRLRVKLTDLGLALAEDDDEFKVTRDGSTVGTIDYMAPEQARDSRASDVRSDIYSLGCTAYHMLAGKPPFAEGGLGERVYKHMETRPQDVRELNPEVGAGFWDILVRMLAKNPDDRYATPTDLLEALKRTPGEASAEGQAEKPSPAAAAPAAEPAAEPRVAKPSSSDMLPPPNLAPAPLPRKLPRPPVAPTPAELPNTLVSPEQARAAAVQFERAQQVMSEGRGDDYARQLLMSSLKLDPTNTLFRKMLRQITQRSQPGLLSRWMGSLSVLGLKAKLRSAKSSGDYRKVLEQGEEVLARHPADVGAHIDMAEAAKKLGVVSLAVWLLEQGREQAPDSVELMKALANLYEERKDLSKAIAVWEQLRKALPSDVDIPRKIDSLSVKQHLSRGRYRK